MRPERVDFGIFMAPFHREGENPTLSLQRNLELIEALDHLGYDEAWIGEHHSAGWETIASPEIFIAAAAERTKHIRLGTGVVSVPYHHPFHIADRMVLLDHLTRGRVMLGVGPGALPGDAYMLGIEPTTQRPRMEEGLGVIIKLMTSDEPVTHVSEWFELHDATLQMKPYQRPTMPMAVASTLSPSGMTAAGKHGVGVLSVASYSEQGLQALKTQWGYCEEAAAKAGRPAPDRNNWRIVMPFHLAESKEEAIADVEDGLMSWNNDYFVNTLGAPNQSPVASGREAIERLTGFGGVIGTPDEAVATINKLQEVSGGFGCILGLAHEWATREKTLKSYELMARYVMPQVQDTVTWIERSAQWARDNQAKFMGGATKAVLQAIADHNAAKDEATDGVGFALPGSASSAVPAKDEEKAPK
ncbi:MAG: LLM class flavin-dependent oxidoreductase [Chloroflexi bacterium]|nr:LLM class flavin-dependent oxidoreductase [Chloroflexota bacterium]